KSTFAHAHFLPTETLSSDTFRALVGDDETDQSTTTDAFDALHYLAALRLKRRKLVVIDATNVQEAARKPLIALARRFYAVPVAIVLDVPEAECAARNAGRENRDFGRHVVARHVKDLRGSLKSLQKEGFRAVYHLKGAEEIAAATLTRVPLYPDKRHETGAFDIIGDVHGEYDKMVGLLGELGYRLENGVPRHPDNRRLIFVGDLVDRGSKVVESATLVMDAVSTGVAFCVPGNHDDKLKRALQGRTVSASHGLQESLNQIAALPDGDREAFTERFAAFVEGLVSHLWLDGGKLAVAHAGITAPMIGRASGAIREFCLYGDTTGATTPEGLPVRRDWAADYRGDTFVVYGHTPVDAVRIVNNTANVDTGAVFGGSLSALRYPEHEAVSFPPLEVALPPAPSGMEGDALHLADYVGRRAVSTRLAGNVVVQPGNNAAALEIMSRFAAHPRWLVYLPPTMSPVETSALPDYLEHPAEAFAYFARQGVGSVICETKHMGSRAVMVVCRDDEAARKHFGAGESDFTGAVLTRTGRYFTIDAALHRAILSETARAMESAGLWDELQTDFVVLDAEILPWNAKAQALLKEQYAPVAAAGVVALEAEIATLEGAARRGIAEAVPALAAAQSRLLDLLAYREAYGRYCWDVGGIGDLRIAPFHLMAAQGRTFTGHDHPWHIGTLARLAGVSPLFIATETLLVDTANAESVAAGVA
ncbi:MAG: polynucleotide kinase-phosphatase, partial [Armatimonadetes bacterium]|nr:polynucleotide kinase-phosphatase [Armatimonadota bacterium]